MKRIKWLLSITAVMLALTVCAQQGARTEANSNTGQEKESPPEAGGAGQNAGDTTGTGNTNAATGNAGTANGNDGNATAGTGGNNGNGDTTAVSAANTAPVPQITSSQSGSPAALSPDHGRERGGTNNVQRASMNMVGSPTGNLNLDENGAVNTDSEMVDRQDHTQEKQISAQNKTEQSAHSSGATDENEAREKNASSDQNVSAKENKSQQTGKEREPKRNRKEKKN